MSAKIVQNFKNYMVMKNLRLYFVLISLAMGLTACSTSKQTASAKEFDDTYASSSDKNKTYDTKITNQSSSSASNIPTNPSENYSNDYQQQKRMKNFDEDENNNNLQQKNYSNPYYEDDDYYYARRIRRFHRSYGFCGYYDPCYMFYGFAPIQTYIFDPWFFTPTPVIYPVVSITYSPWGWRRTQMVMFYDPWFGWTPDPWGWYSCWGWNYGWNYGWGPSWGWGGWYNSYWYGYNYGYWNGYWNGYWHGYYNGYWGVRVGNPYYAPYYNGFNNVNRVYGPRNGYTTTTGVTHTINRNEGLGGGKVTNVNNNGAVQMDNVNSGKTTTIQPNTTNPTNNTSYQNAGTRNYNSNTITPNNHNNNNTQYQDGGNRNFNRNYSNPNYNNQYQDGGNRNFNRNFNSGGFNNSGRSFNSGSRNYGGNSGNTGGGSNRGSIRTR